MFVEHILHIIVFNSTTLLLASKGIDCNQMITQPAPIKYVSGMCMML